MISVGGIRYSYSQYEIFGLGSRPQCLFEFIHWAWTWAYIKYGSKSLTHADSLEFCFSHNFDSVWLKWPNNFCLDHWPN